MGRTAVTAASPQGRRRWARATGGLANAVEGVAPVVRVGSHLCRPATRFDRLGPLRTGEHMRAIDLINGRVARTVVAHGLLFAADAHGKWLSGDARHGVYAGHLEE